MACCALAYGPRFAAWLDEVSDPSELERMTRGEGFRKAIRRDPELAGRALRAASAAGLRDLAARAAGAGAVATARDVLAAIRRDSPAAPEVYRAWLRSRGKLQEADAMARRVYKAAAASPQRGSLAAETARRLLKSAAPDRRMLTIVRGVYRRGADSVEGHAGAAVICRVLGEIPPAARRSRCDCLHCGVLRAAGNRAGEAGRLVDTATVSARHQPAWARLVGSRAIDIASDLSMWDPVPEWYVNWIAISSREFRATKKAGAPAGSAASSGSPSGPSSSSTSDSYEDAPRVYPCAPPARAHPHEPPAQSSGDRGAVWKAIMGTWV